MSILQKGKADFLSMGDWNAICAVCGMKYKASQLKKSWKGYYVCIKDWESRHMSDFYRPHSGEKQVSFTRPEPTDIFTDVTFADTGQDDIPAGTFTVPEE